ncbi:MAG: response regulator [bacterium]|jgi:CheY-like chemotaxis protein|nr:response regulator [bacterium]
MAKKVLIIDDDAEYREATTTLLEAKGYEVITAENGEQGFEKAKSQVPDIILLDVMMTHKSEGFDLARNLKQENITKNVPVIIVSGVRKEMNLPFGFEPDQDWLPVKTVLEKPIKPDTLLKAITENLK